MQKKRKHFLTMGYLDETNKQQAGVFELGKSAVRVTLASLESRTGTPSGAGGANPNGRQDLLLELKILLEPSAVFHQCPGDRLDAANYQIAGRHAEAGTLAPCR
jgi:hypothetical protein